MDNKLATHLVGMTEIIGSNSLSMDEMDIQRCGTSTGQCLSDYLVNAFVKHLIRQVVNERHKSLIY